MVSFSPIPSAIAGPLKMKKGTSEPIYEKYILKALGIEKIDTRDR